MLSNIDVIPHLIRLRASSLRSLFLSGVLEAEAIEKKRKIRIV